jgi:hypothetical protein
MTTHQDPVAVPPVSRKVVTADAMSTHRDFD